MFKGLNLCTRFYHRRETGLNKILDSNLRLLQESYCWNRHQKTPPDLGPNPVRPLEAILSAPRRLQEASKLPFFGSRGLQELSKRPPRGFLRASASKMRFGSNFGPIFDSKSKKGPLDLKNQRNPLYSRRCLWFSHFQLDSLLEPVLRPSWPPFGR